MTYIPTEWKCGDTITAEKLNKLENGLADCCGGGGTPLVVNCTVVNGSDGMITFTLDKTWQEIHDAFMNGTSVLINETNGVTLVSGVYFNEGDGYTIIPSGEQSLHTETADGYPQNVIFPLGPGASEGEIGIDPPVSEQP